MSQIVTVKLKQTLSLVVCLAHLFIPIAGISDERLSESSRKQKEESVVADALWINIIPSRMNFPPGKYPKVSYFDLQSNGRFLFAEGDDPAFMEIVRSGVLSKGFVRRAFQIVDKPSVLNARDTEPGEPIFSDSDWVNVGLSMSGEVKAAGGWAFREEIKDFPEEFRKLVAELKSAAVRLRRATNIKALLSASKVDAKRVELVGRERFIVLNEEHLDRFPPLKQAVLTSRRLVAVQDETQMSRLADLAKRMDPKATYWGLYAIEGRGFYEIGSHYRARAR